MNSLPCNVGLASVHMPLHTQEQKNHKWFLCLLHTYLQLDSPARTEGRLRVTSGSRILQTKRIHLLSPNQNLQEQKFGGGGWEGKVGKLIHLGINEPI